jgi:hypothetical protein
MPILSQRLLGKRLANCAIHQFAVSVTWPPRFGWQCMHQKLMHPTEDLSMYSLMYHNPIPSTMLELEGLLCFCAHSKTAC